TAPAQDREADWSFQEGEIVGRRTGVDWPKSDAQGWLGMGRALREGESLSYEFYHSPGSVAVHPSLGRLAFLIEPAGVRLHWLDISPNAHDWTGLKPDNAVDDSEHRRGPAPLPLKANDWNSMTLALDGGAVRLTLNGVVVYERPLDPSASRG